MRVLILHNRYREPGGEDAVVAAEGELLRSRGHEVQEFVADNAEVDGISALRAAAEAVWSEAARRRVLRLIREFRPDVVHVHNTFARLSPSVYYACREAGVPVVQTLHNYRPLCPNAIFFRDGRPCEGCLGRLPWRGVVHACYRRSHAATVAVAGMVTVHRGMGTWSRMVDVYVALTEFARRKFVAGGFPAERIVVKPNFVHPDPGMGERGGGYALFVGRLSPEKGVRTLLRAWEKLADGVWLKVVGDGPLAGEVASTAARLRNVEGLGRLPRPEVLDLMKGAAFLVFPSEWYECFPVTLTEALATGLPVVAAGHGAMAEIVEDGRTGLLFHPGDPEDLAAKVEWAWTHPKEMAKMGQEARQEYEAKYTAERNYRMLMDIYHQAVEATHGTPLALEEVKSNAPAGEHPGSRHQRGQSCLGSGGDRALD